MRPFIWILFAIIQQTYAGEGVPAASDNLNQLEDHSLDLYNDLISDRFERCKVILYFYEPTGALPQNPHSPIIANAYCVAEVRQGIIKRCQTVGINTLTESIQDNIIPVQGTLQPDYVMGRCNSESANALAVDLQIPFTINQRISNELKQSKDKPLSVHFIRDGIGFEDAWKRSSK